MDTNYTINFLKGVIEELEVLDFLMPKAPAWVSVAAIATTMVEMLSDDPQFNSNTEAVSKFSEVVHKHFPENIRLEDLVGSGLSPEGHITGYEEDWGYDMYLDEDYDPWEVWEDDDLPF